MPEPLRTGLLGCGKIGAVHAAALQKLPESSFAAVCDGDAERAQSFARRFSVRAYPDVRAMVERERLQAVAICTPHPEHARHAVAAMEAGAHVLVEKPLAANLADCDAMLAAARQAGVRLGVVSQRRFFEPVLRLRRAIDEGRIGRPVLGVVLMFNWRDEAYYRSDPWRGRWDTEGGGVLVNQAPHHLDLLQWFMGPIQELNGYAANLNHPYIEVEDTAVASLRFRSGALGSIVASVSQKPGIYAKIHIHGSNGASLGVQTDSGASFVAGMSGIAEPPLNDLWTIPGEEGALADFEREDRQRWQGLDPVHHYHSLQLQDFLQAVLEDRPPNPTAEEGRAVVELIEAIYRSSAASRAQTFPLGPNP
jgi:predicted dehydrogenase